MSKFQIKDANGNIIPTLIPLVPADSLGRTKEEVNKLQKLDYTSLKHRQIYSVVSESYPVKPKKGEVSTALLTISDLFKHTKEINKIINEMVEDPDTKKPVRANDWNAIILPEGFCNRETLNFITTVKFIPS